MATIRSYTTIEQSRKLAEMLPLDSADMYYEEICNLPKAIIGNYILHNQCMEDKDYKKLSNPVLSPAWSLAALLNVLEFPTLENDSIGKGKTGWMVTCYSDGMRYDTTFHDNPIDACVEMILKLHELNLL